MNKAAIEETWEEKFKHWLTTNMRIDTSKADVIISHVERYISSPSPVQGIKSKEAILEPYRLYILPEAFDKAGPTEKVSWDGALKAMQAYHDQFVQGMDFLSVLEENYEAMKRAKAGNMKGVLVNNNPFDCVIETYQDLISIYKNKFVQGITKEGLNEELTGEIIDMSGFTQSNRNHIKIEVLGQENYIGNNIKLHDEIVFRKKEYSQSQTEQKLFTLNEVLYYGAVCAVKGRDMIPVQWFKDNYNLDITKSIDI